MADRPAANDAAKAITFVAAGDMILAGAIHDAANPLFDVIRAADVSSGNLEFVLTASEEASDKLIALKADPAIAPSIAALGFDVLTLANNHMMDFGTAGLAECLAAVKAVGIAPIGAGDTLAESLAPHILTANGARMAFFGVSTHLPNVSAAGPSRPGIAPIRITTRYCVDTVTAAEVPGMAPFVQTEPVGEDLDRLCAAIAEAARGGATVIVNIHWGLPLGWAASHQDELAQYQRPLAHALIEAGAAIIVGHGPHVIQAVEYHRGAPILYSIGNFITHAHLPDASASTGAYPNYDWDSLRTKWNGIACLARMRAVGVSFLSVEFLITKLDAIGEAYPASQQEAEELRARLSVQCERRGTAVELREDGAYWLLAFSPLGA